jgi:hypothetical protein
MFHNKKEPWPLTKIARFSFFFIKFKLKNFYLQNLDIKKN